MTETSLDTLTPGERGTIRRISNAAANVRRRLLEMGLVQGTAIQLVRFAPLGDPIEVRVRGFRLSLRRLEAEAVIVKRDREAGT